MERKICCREGAPIFNVPAGIGNNVDSRLFGTLDKACDFMCTEGCQGWTNPEEVKSVVRGIEWTIAAQIHNIVHK